MAKSKVSSKALQLLGQDWALLGYKVFSHLNRRMSGLGGGKSKVSSKALKRILHINSPLQAHPITYSCWDRTEASLADQPRPGSC